MHDNQKPGSAPVQWEAFWLNYRKPGYISGYEILEKLGGGMFGLVFKARKQSIGKDYAIKFLKVDDAGVRDAVLAELDTVRYFAQVDHANLVSIEDRGEVDGIPYIVMAYAGSETLRDRLAAPTPDRDELLQLLLQACCGAQALHERSLVHFDLKPANIFLKGNIARVGDYGLSKLVAHSRNTLSMGRGTPYYMAPEMLQRKGDARSDIYSLGVILYECLVGDVPFRGDSEWEVLRKHESETPRFPETMLPLHRSVIERCMAKDPGARFDSVGAMIAALTNAPAAPREVRERALPPASPPAMPGAGAIGDPYAGMREAALEFGGHAKRLGVSARKVAVEALGHASGSAQHAIGQAMRTLHQSMREARQQRRLGRKQRRAERAARRRSRPSRPGRVLVTGAALLMLSMCFLSVREQRIGARAPVAVSTGASSGASWAELARRDAAKAARSLDRTLREWQKRIHKQTPTPVVPALPPLPSGLSAPAAARLATQLRCFAEADPYPAGAIVELADAGFAAVVAAIELLDQLDVAAPDDLRAACRLDEFLREVTGFAVTDMSCDEDALQPGPALARNRAAAPLWRQFVHDVLRDDAAAFAAYTQLRVR